MPRQPTKEPDATEIGMNREAELGIVRAAYAKQILAAARVDDVRLGVTSNPAVRLTTAGRPISISTAKLETL